MAAIKSRKHAVSRNNPAHSLTTASLLTSLAIGLPGIAAAQQASGPYSDDQVTTLGKIDVKGERIKEYGAERVASPKFTQPLLDTTQSINVISSDLFNEQGATSLTEALRNSPGVGTFYVGENGNTTTGDAIYMRGFDTSGSIFVDGVRDLGSITRDVFNIEQVEVTKGPSGPDYGRTSPTGAVNMVTKRANLSSGNAASLGYGSDDQKRATADINLPINESAAFRLNLMAQDSDIAGRDTITSERWGVAPSLALGLGSSTRVFFDALHVEQDNLPDGGVVTIGLPGYTSPDPLRPEIGEAPPVDSGNFYGTTSDYDDVSADMFTVRIEHDFSDTMRLQNTTRSGNTRQDYMLTSFMASSANVVTPDINDPSTWTVARSNPTFKDQKNTILTNQTNLNANFVTGNVEHDLSTGLEFTKEKLSTRGVAVQNGTTWPAANIYNPDPDISGLEWGHDGTGGKGETDTAAFYLFDTMKFGEHWQLNAGLRLDDYTTEYANKVVCGARGAPPCGSMPAGTIVPGVDDSSSDTLFSWKVGALYKPTANGSIYANYAISVQPPGGGSLELSSSANNLNNPVFDPQEAKTAEAGVKWNLADDKLLVTAALYDTTITNEIVQDPVDLQYYQTGEKRVRGVEFSAVGKITDAWSLSAGYTKMDTDVIDGPNITADGSRQLTYTPDDAFTAWTTYTLPFGLTIGGGARYSGELKRGTDGAIGTPAYTELYWVVDAVASYAFTENFDLRLNAYNLLDETYVAAINKSGYRYTPGGPRSFLLTANFHF